MVELAALLGASELEPYPVDWSAVERKLGSRLPRDYVEFCTLYPALIADKFIRIEHPSCSNENLNLLMDGMERTEELRKLVEEFPEQYAFGAFPSLDGLLCWGSSASSEQLYWLTAGSVDDWKVVVGDYEDDHMVFDGGFAEFLVEIFSGRLNTPVLGDYVTPLSEISYFK
ncbi:SMI1/KNR4 family protein [Amycolatopsis japonica]|uniref:SMI1/KNR4 family protein n=1 Tax=Amycolatopsis japonica TaxID=208439 RepID=UPI0033F5EA71